MTIFVDVLKKLIRDSLTTISGDLYTKIKSSGYNHELSREQHEEIGKLEVAIITFESTNNDEIDAKTFIHLITRYREEVKCIREKHGHAKDSGTTVPSLNKLILRVPEFYEKLVTFQSKFDLLNQKNMKTPEGLVYFYACCYLGEDIFEPKTTTKVEIRIQKENKLAERLKTLRELIKPTYTLAERKERTLPVLDELETDNKGVGKSAAPALPSVSVLGIFQLGAPSEWFAPRAGRLGEWIDVARAEVEKLTPENSDCPRTEVSAAVAAAVKQVSAKPKSDDEHEEDDEQVHGAHASL